MNFGSRIVPTVPLIQTVVYRALLAFPTVPSSTVIFSLFNKPRDDDRSRKESKCESHTEKCFSSEVQRP